MEEHQAQQAGDLILRGQHLHQHPAEPDRLGAKLAANELVGLRRRVPLVEDQVDRRQHRGQARRELLGLRDLVRDSGLPDLALRSHEPLRHRALADEERPRDLGGGEPAQRAQRERHSCLGGDRGMGRREHQPQPIIRQLPHAHIDRLLGRRLGRLEQSPLLREDALAPQPVDRLVPSHADDPGRGIVRHTMVRPALERDDERLLDRLLGEIEVAEDADQGRDRPPRLAPEQAVDYIRALGYEAVSPTFAFGSS